MVYIACIMYGVGVPRKCIQMCEVETDSKRNQLGNGSIWMLPLEYINNNTTSHGNTRNVK